MLVRKYSFDDYLCKILALLSYPIQGVLSILRLRKRNNHNTISDDKKGGLSSEQQHWETALRCKLALFFSTASCTERRSLLTEFAYLSAELPQRGTCRQKKKRGNSEISQHCADGHNSAEDLIIEGTGISGKNWIDFQQLNAGTSYVTPDDVLQTAGIINKVQEALGSDGSGNHYKNDRVISNFRSSKHTFRPYHMSSVWSAQQQFYEKSGASVWERGEVPSLISSNPFVADMYVHMILQMANNHWCYLQEIVRSQSKVLSECHASVKNDYFSPMRKLRVAVVEIGAGHGLLSYLMARKFQVLMSDIELSKNDSKSSEIKSDEEYLNISKNNLDNENASIRDEKHSKMYSDLQSLSRFNVTVVGTDFHSSVFADLVKLPWIR